MLYYLVNDVYFMDYWIGVFWSWIVYKLYDFENVVLLLVFSCFNILVVVRMLIFS